MPSKIQILPQITPSPLGRAGGGALKVGDKLPESFWTQQHGIYLNGSSTTASFQQFKGKAILLDFWATWCSPCLKGFPRMNVLQTQHGKYLKVLMVNTNEQDTQSILSGFYKKQQEEITGFSLSLIRTDQFLRETFQIKSIPHYIWIGADGRIKAITNADAVTEMAVKRLVAGLALNLKLKEN